MPEPDFDELSRQIETLRTEVAALQEQLAARPTRSLATMKASLRCPGCEGRSILHVAKVADQGDGINYTMAVATKGLFTPRPLGRFECYVCADCGWVEWYVADPSNIDPDDEHIRLVDVEDADAGPYR